MATGKKSLTEQIKESEARQKALEQKRLLWGGRLLAKLGLLDLEEATLKAVLQAAKAQTLGVGELERALAAVE